MKNYESIVLAVYEGVLTDASIRWPNHRASFGKDLSYLRRAVKERGLSFLTITLPSAAKALMKRLDHGDQAYPCGLGLEYPQGYPMRRGTQRPKLFGDLYDMVFDVDGLLRPEEECDIEAVKFLLQLLMLAKNARLDCHPSKVKETLDEFFTIEGYLPRSHENTWDSDIPSWKERTGHPLWGTGDRMDSESESAFEARMSALDGADPRIPWAALRAYAGRVVKGVIGEYPVWDLAPKHGPGAISEKGVGVKYDFPHWPRKLEQVFPFDWYGSGSLDSEVRPDDGEPCSRLIAVPKSQKGPRLICAEPVAHQWIQQGIWRWLEQRVEKTVLNESIRFRDQSQQQQRALSSSMDGSLVTIDLSSASDHVSTRLVEFLFQGTNLVEAFHASRTRCMMQDISEDHPKLSVLRKFSTMGSAVTFPVQSLVFLIITSFALKLSRNGFGVYSTEENVFLSERQTYSLEDLRSVTVFGDDIIAPTDAYDAIELLLEECGLKVNITKTFYGDNFRESCGMYAFRGVDVSPAYLLESYDGSPDSLTATMEASNNFHLKGYWATAYVVTLQIPEQELKKLFVSGPDRVGGLGLVSFCGAGYHLHKKRWDANTQQAYIKVLTVASRSGWTQGSGEASLAQYFFEQPDCMLPYKSGKAGRSKLRKCFGQVLIEGGEA